MPEDDSADLLAELATLDEVSAWIPTCLDQEQGIVPIWSELILEIKRGHDSDFPLNTIMPLRRHDGELIISVIHSVLHPTAGGSAAEGLWADIDLMVDRIQARVSKGKKPRSEDVGQARGLAIALARLCNPYEPDVDQIRAIAMERWEGRNSLDAA